MKQPFFSIIIPTYNRKPFLQKCLATVCAQTYAHFECLIVDDGSTDGTCEYVHSIGDERIRYFQQENQGPSAARNHALREAKGEWIAFLDSDDWWEANKLERFGVEIEQTSEIKIFHSQEVWFKDGTRHNPKFKHEKPDGDVYLKALPLCCISISTAVVHRSVFDEVGAFDESLPACEDYDFWLRSTSKYSVRLIDEYLTLKDGGRPDQLSFSMWGLDQYRIRALAKMLEQGDLREEYRAATFDQLKRKCQIFANGAQKRGKTIEANYYRELMNKWA